MPESNFCDLRVKEKTVAEAGDINKGIRAWKKDKTANILPRLNGST